MKTIYEAELYLVGRQVLNEDEVTRFLKDHDVPADGWSPFGIGGWHPDAVPSAGQVIPEMAGRLCYMSFARPRPGGNEGYLSHIKDVGHGSVLEHSVWNLIFCGVSRSLTHELVRHRAGFGYSQLSQRYVDESTAEYVVPPELAEEVRGAEEYLRDRAQNTPEFGKFDALTSVEAAFERIVDGRFPQPLRGVYVGLEWLRSVMRSHVTYCHLVEYLLERLERTDFMVKVAAIKARQETEKGFEPERDDDGAVIVPKLTQDERTTIRKAARGAGRSVLPNATETKIFVTLNARAARHFFNMRGNPAADAEIRCLACGLWQLLNRDAPHVFGDYELYNLPDGSPALRTRYGHV